MVPISDGLKRIYNAFSGVFPDNRFYPSFVPIENGKRIEYPAGIYEPLRGDLVSTNCDNVMRPRFLVHAFDLTAEGSCALMDHIVQIAKIPENGFFLEGAYDLGYWEALRAWGCSIELSIKF